MKKLLVIALFIVGCDNSTEPKDCAGIEGGKIFAGALTVLPPTLILKQLLIMEVVVLNYGMSVIQ